MLKIRKSKLADVQNNMKTRTSYFLEWVSSSAQIWDNENDKEEWRKRESKEIEQGEMICSIKSVWKIYW